MHLKMREGIKNMQTINDLLYQTIFVTDNINSRITKRIDIQVIP